MTTEVQIANDALALLNVTAIGSLADTSDRAVRINQIFARSRQAVLRDHPWNFAVKRVASLAYTEPAATLTPAAGALTAGTTGVNFTAGSAVFTDTATDAGKVLRPDGAVGEATITAISTTSVAVATIDTAFASVAAIASGDWRLYYAPPAHTYDYAHPKPSGWLRWLDTEPSDPEPYRVEGQYLVSNADELDLSYITDITDPTLWDALFVEAFAAYIALKIAMPVTGKKTVVDDMKEAYRLALAKAKAVDGQESGTPRQWESNSLIDVRSGVEWPVQYRGFAS